MFVHKGRSRDQGGAEGRWTEAPEPEPGEQTEAPHKADAGRGLVAASEESGGWSGCGCGSGYEEVRAVGLGHER